MRIPSYSSVLGFAFLVGMLAATVSLISNLPEPDTRYRRDGLRTRPRPEGSAYGTVDRLIEGEKIAAGDPEAAVKYNANWRTDAERRAAKPDAVYQVWYDLGWANRVNGDEVQASAAWNTAVALIRSQQPPQFGPIYDLACCLALLGDADGALTELGNAIDLGWNDRRHTAQDRDFQTIREDPRFKELLRRMPRSSSQNGPMRVGT